MKKGLLQLSGFLLAFGLPLIAAAQDHDKPLAPAFKFKVSDSLLNPRLSSILETSPDNTSTYRRLLPEARLNNYDAILYFPMHHQGVSLDLGVNLRMLEEQGSVVERSSGGKRDWLNIDLAETRTLLHASAIFDLPFNGLRAGVSGTYNPDQNFLEYDYRAKLSYTWKNGFGLEGGWLHQQKTNELQGLNTNDPLNIQGLFLDMNYRF